MNDLLHFDGVPCEAPTHGTWVRGTIMSLACALALAACSSEPEANESVEDYAERVGTGTTTSPVPETLPTSSLGQPAPPPLADLGAPKAVPAKFRGVWDFVDGNCSDTSDLRLAVGATQLGFYESAGQVNGFEQPDENTVILNLSMEGEGETWEERTRLELVDGGKILEAIDVSSYGSGQPMRRKRCP